MFYFSLNLLLEKNINSMSATNKEYFKYTHGKKWYMRRPNQRFFIFNIENK